MANESRVLDIFGPNFLIESNGESVGIGGFAYQIYATTKTPAGGNTIKYQQVLYDSGLSAIDAEGTLEIQTGLKNSGTSRRCCTHIRKRLDKIKRKKYSYRRNESIIFAR